VFVVSSPMTIHVKSDCAPFGNFAGEPDKHMGDTFKGLEEAFRSDGSTAAFNLLIRTALEAKDYRLLFGARLMQARHGLRLPLIETEPTIDLSGERRSSYENALQEAARETGKLFLADGDIVSAWTYFKALGDPGPVSAAIEKMTGGEQIDRVIEIAFHEGVNPRKGFEMILEHHGICRAITLFGSNRDPASRQHCLRSLVRALHGQVKAGLKETIASVEGAVADDASLAELIVGRPWLFEGTSSYVDSTHLTTLLRFTPELEDAESLRMAAEMADYGRRLAPMFHFRGDPPFEDTYADHAVYLWALLGEEVDCAIAHFRKKVTETIAASVDTTPAEVLIELLVRLGRYAEAIQASLEFFPSSSATPISCASAIQLCQMAGDYRQLRELALKRGDLLAFTAAVIQG
jgi:hypothetical protein